MDPGSAPGECPSPGTGTVGLSGSACKVKLDVDPELVPGDLLVQDPYRLSPPLMLNRMQSLTNRQVFSGSYRSSFEYPLPIVPGQQVILNLLGVLVQNDPFTGAVRHKLGAR